MKIAFLNSTFGKVFRGGETFTGELAKSLGGLGHEVRVFGGFREFWDSKEKPDILIPVNGRWQVILSKIWCLFNNKKIIISGQSGLGIDDRINLWSLPDCFVALSDFQMQWSKKINPFVRFEKISNGVDLDKFSPKGAKIETLLKKPIILIVSALTLEKRIDLAIKAVSKIKNVSLLIVGKGEKEKELLELGNKLLPGRFEIRSFPFDQMPQVYRAADLFVFSTVPWESFGIVMLEAMATNLPVVVSDDPIRKEIVGNAGFTVDVTDTNLFAQKIKEALEKDWGNVPQERAKLFSWDNIAKQYDEVFKRLKV